MVVKLGSSVVSNQSPELVHAFLKRKPVPSGELPLEQFACHHLTTWKSHEVVVRVQGLLSKTQDGLLFKVRYWLRRKETDSRPISHRLGLLKFPILVRDKKSNSIRYMPGPSGDPHRGLSRRRAVGVNPSIGGVPQLFHMSFSEDGSPYFLSGEVLALSYLDGQSIPILITDLGPEGLLDDSIVFLSQLLSGHRGWGKTGNHNWLRLFRDLITTLEYVHSRPRFHGDIKPELISLRVRNGFWSAIQIQEWSVSGGVDPAIFYRERLYEKGVDEQFLELSDTRWSDLSSLGLMLLEVLVGTDVLAKLLMINPEGSVTNYVNSKFPTGSPRFQFDRKQYLGHLMDLLEGSLSGDSVFHLRAWALCGTLMVADLGKGSTLDVLFSVRCGLDDIEARLISDALNGYASRDQPLGNGAHLARVLNDLCEWTVAPAEGDQKWGLFTWPKSVEGELPDVFRRLSTLTEETVRASKAGNPIECAVKLLQAVVVIQSWLLTPAVSMDRSFLPYQLDVVRAAASRCASRAADLFGLRQPLHAYKSRLLAAELKQTLTSAGLIDAIRTTSLAANNLLLSSEGEAPSDSYPQLDVLVYEWQKSREPFELHEVGGDPGVYLLSRFMNWVGYQLQTHLGNVLLPFSVQPPGIEPFGHLVERIGGPQFLKGKQLLEMECGLGENLERALRFGMKSSGTSTVEWILALARGELKKDGLSVAFYPPKPWDSLGLMDPGLVLDEHTDINLICAPPNKLDSLAFSTCFDVILARETLCHITQKRRCLEGVFSTLNPGGFLLMTDPIQRASCSTEEWADMVVPLAKTNLETMAGYRSMLEEIGFVDVIIRDHRRALLQHFMKQSRILSVVSVPPQNAHIKRELISLVASALRLLQTGGPLGWAFITARKPH